MSQITYDLSHDVRAPHRGDRLRSSLTTYYVIHSRQVQRRKPDAGRRFSLWVEKMDDIETELRQRLIGSALRRGGSLLFPLYWNPRSKK